MIVIDFIRLVLFGAGVLIMAAIALVLIVAIGWLFIPFFILLALAW